MKAIQSAARSGGKRTTGWSTAWLTLLLGVAMVAMPLVGASAAPSNGASALAGVVNVNTASPDELSLLPGIGAARAAAIVDVRKSRGGFQSIDELMDVKGIGPSMLERLRPHVTLKGKTTARSTKGSSPGGAKSGQR